MNVNWHVFFIWKNFPKIASKTFGALKGISFFSKLLLISIHSIWASIRSKDGNKANENPTRLRRISCVWSKKTLNSSSGRWRPSPLKRVSGKSRGGSVSLETRKALLGHANGDITTHYSAAELQELIDAAEAIVNRGKHETPNLMLIRRKAQKTVGKVSEKKKKGLTGNVG